MSHVVIVGAGQAGSSCAAKLRSLGFEGQITMIGEEDALPYQRPPLSKAYLLGEMELERLFLRPASFYHDNNIDLLLGQTVQGIDAKAKTISLDGQTLAYDELVLTTGSRPRHLPKEIGGALGNVFAVRTLKDIDNMSSLFQDGNSVVIIGGGYIGLEAAAVASKRGLKVTVVEMAERILQRVACPETSNYFRDLHQSRGVEILESVGLEELQGNDTVLAARLTNGTVIDADFVIAGIGIIPNAELAQEAGLEIDNGIKTNASGQTSAPHIWSAGDCASFPFQSTRIRLESVPNAIDQAECVAQNIMGQEENYVAKPWFWSDQYDIKLQIAGLNTGYDNVITRQGETSTSFWYFKGDQLLAVDAMNDPRAYMIGKRLIEAGKTADKAAVADASIDLKSLLA